MVRGRRASVQWRPYNGVSGFPDDNGNRECTADAVGVFCARGDAGEVA
jgi:hypothetical protein